MPPFSGLRAQPSELKILLIMSSPEELQPFLRLVRRRPTSLAGAKAWHFQGRGYDGLALQVGMGGDAPRLLTTLGISAFNPHCLLVAGFGGALTPQIPPAGIFIASESWRLATARGPLSQVPFSPPAPPAALVSLLRARGLPAFAGAVLTTPAIIPKASLIPSASHLPLPVLDLETATVAAVAQNCHLPLLAVRAITDGAGEEIRDFLADILNRHQGVPLSCLLRALVADPRRLGYCLHLWRRSLKAGSNLARALNLILDHLAGRTIL